MSNEAEYKMPSDPAQLQAFTRIDTYVKPYDMNETQKFYNSWAKTYDDDYKAIPYHAHSMLVNSLSSLISEEQRKSENFHILDLASGTGNCGVTLREHGFSCTIDGIEANEAMNVQAVQKNIYRNLTVHIVTPDTRIPAEDCSYDAIISTGGFSRTHIQAECIKDVVRILKVGGLFWFSVRNTSLACDYNKSVEAVLAELQSTGSIEVILKNKFDYYSYNVEQQDSTEKVAVPGLERCIRKLK
nr:uncharacterized protein LOC100178168 [Ciona intestinalis]XP_026693698.1 uncharacterized protein LOC100178168 [Ciona intestinalis]|eukprot:XP_002121559.1 uncharacterized protein LOC100178168 [Ciona intestinalis]